MKKKILSLVLAICLIVPCVILLSSCKVDTFYLHVNLNGGDYTEIYKQENNYGGNNVIMVVNPKLYDKFSENIAQRKDMTPPEGKVFAGWYLNKDCTPDYYFNKTNWNRIVEEKKTKESKSATIYAYWIDKEKIALSFDLEGSGLEFNQSYKSDQNINYNISRFIGTPADIMLENLPTALDIIVPEDKTFNGWYINGSTEVNKETLEDDLTTLRDSNADIRVYPKVIMKPEVDVIVYASIEGTQVLNYTQYSGEYYFKENTLFEVGQYYNYEHGLKVYKDEFDKVSNFLNEIVTNNIIEKSESVQNSEFAGWKIVQNDNGINLIEFNETNWNALVGDPTSSQSVKIVATWN